MPVNTNTAPDNSLIVSVSPNTGKAKMAVKTDWLNKLTEAIVGFICPNA